MKKSLLFFSVFVLTFLKILGQNIAVQTTASGPIRVCGPEITFSIVVSNLSSSQDYTNITVNSDMPPGVNFLTSGTVTGGVYQPSSPEDLNNPEFAIGDLPFGQSKTLTFQANANCDLIPYVKTLEAGGSNLVNNITAVRYYIDDIQHTFNEPDGSVSYNALYPALQLTMDNAQASQDGTRDEVKTRSLTVINSGTGFITEAVGITLEITHSTGLEFNGLTTLPAGIITPADITSGFPTTTITLHDFSLIGDGDDLFETNEQFEIIESVKIVSCQANNVTLNTNYVGKWGCQNQICSNSAAFESAAIDFIEGEPVFTLSELTGTKINHCGNFDLEFQFKNSGDLNTDYIPANQARNVQLVLRDGFANNTTVSTFSNFQIKVGTDWVPISTKGISVSHVNEEWRLSFSSTDPDGPGGIEDLDGDGIFDDLSQNNFVQIKATLNVSCPTYLSNGTFSYDFFYFTVWPTYQDVCYKLPPVGVIPGEFGSYYNRPPTQWPYLGTRVYNKLQNQLMDGPVDLVPGVPGVYTMTIDRNVLAPDLFYSGNYYHCPFNEFYSELVVPEGYAIEGDVIWVHPDGTQTVVTTSNLGPNTIRLNGGGWKGSYRVTFVQNCNPEFTYDALSTINWDMYYDCEDCSCRQHIADLSYDVYNHCPSCPGFHTNSFNITRKTLGWPEPSSGYYTDNTLLPGLQYNESNAPADLRLDAGLENDRIQAIATGELTAGTYNNVHVELEYVSPINANLLEFKSGFLRVQVGANPYQDFPLTSPGAPVNTGNNTFVFDFSSTSHCPTCPSTFAAGTKIDLHTEFEIIRHPSLPDGEHRIQYFRAVHYGLNGTTKESCESFGDVFTIVKIRYAQTGFNTIWGIHGCDPGVSTPRSTFWNYAHGVISGDPFPNEFRPIATFGDIKLPIPSDWYTHHPDNAITFTGGGVSLPSPTDLGNGVLQWTRDGNFPIVDPTAPNADFTIRFRLLPTCVYNSSSHLFYADYDLINYYYTDQPEVLQYRRSTNTSRYNHMALHKPNLNIAGGTEVQGYSQTLIVPVTISNLNTGTTRNALNTWLTFAPASTNIQLVNVTAPGGQAVPVLVSGPDASGRYVYQLGNIAAGANNLQYNLHLQYTNCVAEQLENFTVSVRSSCYGYPADYFNPGCAFPERSTSFSLRYKTAEFQWGELIQEEVNTDLCQSFTYMIPFVSSLFADMNEMHLYIDLPDGVSIDPNVPQEFEHPAGSGNWRPLPASVTDPDGRIHWRLSADDSPDMNPFNPFNPFSGTRINTPTQQDNNKVNVRLNLITACSSSPEAEDGFDPGVPVIINGVGETNCQEINDRSHQFKVNLDGVELEVLDITLDAGDFLTCTPLTPVTVSISNPGSIQTVSDRLEVILPDGVDYVSMNGGEPAPQILNGPQGTQRLRWTFPPLAASGLYSLSFNTSVQPGTPEGEVVISARVTQPFTTTCTTGEQTCNLRGTTAFISLNRNILSDPVKPVITVNNQCPEKPLIAGAPLVFTISNPVSGAIYDWDFNGDNVTDLSGTNTSVTHVFLSAGSYSITVGMNASGGTCSAISDPLEIDIIEIGFASIQATICNGQIVTLTVFPSDLPMDDYLWFRDGVLLAHSGSTMDVCQPGTYRSVIKSLSCVEDEDDYSSVDPLPSPYYLAQAQITITTIDCSIQMTCEYCPKDFIPEPGKDYIVTAWVKENTAGFTTHYENAAIKMDFYVENAQGEAVIDPALAKTLEPSGQIIEGWQRIEKRFTMPTNAVGVAITLLNPAAHDIYYDDIRVHPVDGNMKSFVYDPLTLRLMAVLDENNYATFYEYDQEGKLIRIKKETERGIVTIQESMNNIYKKDTE